MKKSVIKAARDYKKGDHLMVRKTFGMKDVVYKKSEPSRELWKSEVAFDVNFCLFAVGLVSVFIILCVFAAKMWHFVRRTAKHLGMGRKV